MINLTKTYKAKSIDEIKLIKPLWHIKMSNIDLTLQPDQLIEKYVKNGFHIYKSTWTELHKALDKSYSKLYSKSALWSNQQDPDKIARIIQNWENETPLIPPMMIDNGYNKLVPADGKHRVKVASILDNEEIYFILFDVDLPTISKYFQPKLID